MGVYTLDCTNCKKPYKWFSGAISTMSSLCIDCRNGKNIMTKEPQNHLESIISLQAELISFLKAEIERLKTENMHKFTPYPQPSYPGLPGTPYIDPQINPYINQPINPLTSPYIVTSGDIKVNSGEISTGTQISGSGVTNIISEDILKSYKN